MSGMLVVNTARKQIHHFKIKMVVGAAVGLLSLGFFASLYLASFFLIRAHYGAIVAGFGVTAELGGTIGIILLGYWFWLRAQKR